MEQSRKLKGNKKYVEKGKTREILLEREELQRLDSKLTYTKGGRHSNHNLVKGLQHFF